MSFDECSHQYKLLGRTVSSWHRYPPVIGKMKICGRCGAIHAGLNSVTAAGNYIDMTHATAPGNPGSGLVRIYSDTNDTMKMKDENGTVTNLVGGGGTSALNLENSQATEATTTSASETDLLTVSSLSIAATKPFMIWAIVRASDTGVTFGLKLNTTQVMTATGLVAAAGSGVLWIYVGPRVTNQLRALTGWCGTGYNSGTDGGVLSLNGIYSSADHPTATITQVTITADSNGSITAGADELRVYEMATS